MQSWALSKEWVPQTRLSWLFVLPCRVRCVFACKCFLQLGASSTTLWDTVDNASAKVPFDKFLTWVSSHARQIRRLELQLPWPDDVVNSTYRMVGCLKDSPLVSLAVAAHFCRLPLLPALGALRCLKQLQLMDTIPGGDAAPLTVPRQISELSSLTCLDLWQCHGYILADGCLPPSLHRLMVRLATGTSGLPSAIRAATQLERLDLEVVHVEGQPSLDCAGLDDLSHLTVLGLRRCNLHALPPLLTRLTKLVCLDLSNNFELGLNPAPLCALAQLTGLREIDLSCCGLSQFPEELLQSASLEVGSESPCIALL